MEKLLFEGVGTLAEKDGALVSAEFSSVADRVVIKLLCENEGNLTVFVKRSTGEVFEFKTVAAEKQETGYSVEFEFDPSSLAVYQDAESFMISVEASASPSELSVFESSIEPSAAWQDSRNMLTTLDDGTPAVFVKLLSGEKIAVPRVPKKALFVGNSLVYGMSHGYYGMCASAPDKDYFHYVSEYIKKFSPECVFTKLYGSYLEHSENMEMFDDWFYRDAMKQFTVEDNFISAEMMLDPELDLIFLQMGDNVNTEEKMETFKKAIFLFIERIKERCPKARIIFVHSWYGITKTGATIKSACEKWDIERVDISCLHSIETEAREQKTYITRDGSIGQVSERWISHPGDLGMKKIAERMIERLALEG